MFRDLIPRLADRYHVIAPDYPGFGHSATPDRQQFSYTFAHIADLMDGLLRQLGVPRYALYVQDYGAPVGYRLALQHRDLSRCQGLDSNIYPRKFEGASGITFRIGRGPQ